MMNQEWEKLVTTNSVTTSKQKNFLNGYVLLIHAEKINELKN